MSARRRLLGGLAVATAIAAAAVLIVNFVLLGPSPAQASFTTLSIISGTVEIRDGGTGEFRLADDGETLDIGDAVRTAADSRALITFFEGSTLEMEPETEVTLERLEGQEEGGFFTKIGQSLGVTWHRVVEFADPASAYEVETPAAVAAVRGTLFQVSVGADGFTSADVTEGWLVVSNKGIEKTVKAGWSMEARPDEPLVDSFQTPPPPSTLELKLGSAAILLVVDPHSAAVGHVPPPELSMVGYPVNQVLGATMTELPEEPQVVLMRRVVNGTYEAFLFGIADGDYDLEVTARNEDRLACRRHIEGAIKEGERWVLSVDIKEEEGRILGCSIGEPRRTDREPNAALVLRQPLVARLLPMARPVAAALSPTPKPTVAPKPTPPSPSPTLAAPSPSPIPTQSWPTPVVVPQALAVVTGPTPTPTPSPMHTSTVRSAVFVVKKDFIPNSGDSVSVRLKCTSGDVSPAKGSASEASAAEFTVTGYEGNPTCTATEDPIPTDYQSSGTCAAALSAGGCTITNTLRSVRFVVKKDFIPGSGDSVSVSLKCTSGDVSPASGSATEASAAEFTVTRFEGDPTCTATEAPIPTDYESSGTCAAALSAGECTITNTKRGTIIVEKQTEPDGAVGSYIFTGDASGEITDDGQIVVSGLAPGTYRSVESDPASDSYLSSIVCDDGGSATPSSGDVATGTATFEVDPGETVKCTFTNTLRSVRFVVRKDFIPDSGDSVTVSLSCSDGTVVATPLHASEAAPAVFTVKGFTSGATCTAIEAPVPAGYQSSGTCAAALSAGECTITNALPRGTIIVEKQTEPDGAVDGFIFTGDASGEISDDEQIVVSGLVPGTYSSVESDPAPGFYLSSIVCDDGGSPTPSSGDVGARTATFQVDAGETVKCTFTNALTPIRTADIRVVLTWGPEPRDLDAHLSGPICGTTERFHVSYLDIRPVPYAELDADDVDGGGPEAITIWAYNDLWVPGEYDFWLDNYSRTPDFGASSAMITVFKEGKQVAQFAVADEPGADTTALDIWRVVNLMLDEQGNLTLNREGHGFLDATDGPDTIPPPVTGPTAVPCPPLPLGSSGLSSVGTASGGNHGSDPLAAALALAAAGPMLAVIPIGRLWRRR